jgi:hypothetical protein
MKSKNLLPRQELFVREYLIDLNAARAAKQQDTARNRIYPKVSAPCEEPSGALEREAPCDAKSTV